MKIESSRFGTLEVAPERIIEFPRGLVGMANCKRFSLFHREPGTPGYFILQSLDDPAIALHIADPARYGLSYELVLSDDDAADLALAEVERRVAECAAQLAVVVILNKETPGQPVQVNLNGPLILNLDTRRGLQQVVVGANLA